jgi:RNA polymerase sigma-70 factor (ECF subfamily)
LTASAAETEAALVTLVQQGDEAAFQQLLRNYLPRIHGYAARMLDNPVEANDITQEVFLRFWQKSKTFDPDRAKLSTWLHQIAHNLCIDYFRRHSRLTGIDDQQEPASDTLEIIMQTAEQKDQVKRLIQLLPERQRSANGHASTPKPSPA